MVDTLQYDVFLSHNSQQKAWVRAFAKVLSGLGLSVYFDEESVAPGESVIPAIDRGLAASRHIVLVLSNGSLASKWVGLEMAVALYNEVEQPVQDVIPVQLEDIDPKTVPGFIRAKSIIDLRDPSSREEKLRRLIRHLGYSETLKLPIWRLKSVLSVSDEAQSNLRVASLPDLKRWNWDTEILLNHLLAIDYELMEHLSPNHAGNTAQWAPAFVQNPNTWRILVNKENTVGGYWHFTPLFKEELALAKTGLLLDSTITPDKIAPIDDIPGVYDAYIVAICMLPDFRNAKNMQLLFGSFLDALDTLAENSSYIREVVANGYTQHGVRLCRAFQMDSFCKHSEHGEIFCSPIARFLSHPMAESFPELRRRYAEVGLLAST